MMKNAKSSRNAPIGKFVCSTVGTSPLVVNAPVSSSGGAAWPFKAFIILWHWLIQEMNKHLSVGRVVFGHRGSFIALMFGLMICLMGPLSFSLNAQPNSSQINVIPKPDDTPGVTRYWGQKMTGGFYYDWAADPTMTANIRTSWPVVDTTGFLYNNGDTTTQWLPAGSCGISCMDLTSTQTATGIKTFQNGLVLEGTTTSQTFTVLPTYTLTVGASGALSTEHTAGQSAYFNSAGVQRILLSNGAGSSGTSGIIRTANATDTINSIDGTLGMFSAVGFQVGTYGTPIPIIDAAGLVTPVSFQLTTGAVNGYCLVSDATGVGSWAACSAGGSFVTTNTAQTGLTGTKEWNSNHTYNAHILAGAASTYDLGTNAAAWRVGYIDTASVEHVEINDPARSAFWRMSYGSVSNSIILDSGSGAQRELTVQVFSATDTQWNMRGTLLPASVGGANGDIGATGTKWRDAFFSGTVSADAFDGLNVTLSTLGSISIASGRNLINSTTLTGYNAALTDGKLLLSWGGSGSGIIRTFDNSGTYQNSFEATGIQTNVAYAVGPFGSPTTVIDNAGNATFSTIKMTTAPSAGYVLTSDASGNGTWQAAGAGSFVTTNTNQTGLSGTKQWTNAHTFVGGVAVQLTSTARDWIPESHNVYSLGSTGTRWRDLWIGNNLTVGGTLTSFITSSTFLSSSVFVTNSFQMNTGASSGYVLTSDGSGNGTWQPAGGGSYVTTNTTQTGLTGNKEWINTHTFVGGVAINASSTARTITPQSDAVYNLGGSSAKWNSIFASGLYAYGGTIEVSNSTGTINRAAITLAGLVLSNSAGSSTIFLGSNTGAVTVNGAIGQTTSVVIGGCTMNFTSGWLTSKSGC